jgi:hypothetical protein
VKSFESLLKSPPKRFIHQQPFTFGEKLQAVVELASEETYPPTTVHLP